MKKALPIIALQLAFISLQAQREYAFCPHSYCHELHIYQLAYRYFIPAIPRLIIDETGANPTNRIVCKWNVEAIRFYKLGYEKFQTATLLTSGVNKNYYNGPMKSAVGYFKEAIKRDSSFCDAYDNLVNCFYLAKQYDSAFRILDIQRNPSFHATLAKGVIYYEGLQDYVASEKYFKSLTKEKATAIYFYYLAMSQIKLHNLEDAKKSVVDMKTTLKAWGDGWAMEEKSKLLQGVIACKENDFEKAFVQLDRIKKEYNKHPIFCYYYGIAQLNKKSPNKSKGEKNLERAKKLGYNAAIMI